MGHSVHFLQRIERLDMQRADRALALYRQPELVREVLARIRLPDRADRLALALEDREHGPHIVLSREGHFITCLAPGMHTGDLPVVSHGQFERHLEKASLLRDTLARIGEESETRRLAQRIMCAGSTLAREEFNDAAMLQPLICHLVVQFLFDTAAALLSFHTGFSRARYRRMTPAVRDELRWWWERAWAVGHLSVLAGVDPAAIISERTRATAAVPDNLPYCPSSPAIYTLMIPVILRGAWLAARCGRPMLSAYKQYYYRATCLSDIMDSATGLAALGHRHRPLRGEIHKILKRRGGPAFDSNHPGGAAAARFVSRLEKRFAAKPAHTWGITFHLPAGSDARQVLEASPVMRADDLDDFPRELERRAWLAQDESALAGNWQQIERQLCATADCLPWLAQLDPAALYLPRDVLSFYHEPWRPEPVLAHLQAHHALTGSDQPMRRTEKIGRNALCPCGSGAKYKRCCGDSAHR